MKSAANAAKVGLFLICFFVLIVGVFGFLGRSIFAKSNRIYYVRMTDAGGVSEGTKVVMAGVRIGTVRQVKLEDPHHAQLVLAIRQENKLPIGAAAVIPGSLIGFGEGELTINSPTDFKGYLPDGAVIDGSKGGPLDALVPGGGKDIFANLNKTLEAVQKLLQDQQLQGGLKKLMSNTNQTMLSSQATLARFSALSDRVNNLIATNQGNLQSIVLSMKGTLQDVHFTASELAKFVKQGKIQSSTTDLFAKLNGIAKQSSDLLASLNKVAGDPVTQANLKSTAKNLADTSAKGPELADNMTHVTANVADITEKSKDLPDKLNKVLDHTVSLEDNLNKLVDKFNGAKGPSSSLFNKIHLEADEFRETNPGYSRTDLNLFYDLPKGYFTIGLYDAFERNKLNLQMATPIAKNLNFRYGIYAAKAGVGVDYSFTKRLSLRTDLFDPNSTELDAKLRYDFGSGIIGYAGVDRIVEHNASFNVGVGYRF